MARLSINELSTYRWTFEEDVTHYAAAKVPAIGVWRQKLSDFGEEKALELLRETGLAVSNLLWAGGFTGGDGRSFRESLEDAFDAIRITATLGAGCLVVYTGSRGGHTHNHARRLIAEATKQLLPVAEEHGVTLAIEPMHPGCAADWTFLASLDDALALLDKHEHPRLGLVFDTYHLGFDEKNIARIAEIAPKIKIVHLGDGRETPGREPNRARLGDGIVPLEEIVAALKSAGYDGDYDVEVIGEDVVGLDYRTLIEHIQGEYQRLLK